MAWATLAFLGLPSNLTQLSRAVARIEKICKLCDYIPKILYCPRIKISLSLKFFNHVPSKKSDSQIFTWYSKERVIVDPWAAAGYNLQLKNNWIFIKTANITTPYALSMSITRKLAWDAASDRMNWIWSEGYILCKSFFRWYKREKKE